MAESVLRFGPRSALVGVLSTPDEASSPQRPAVLTWNVGVNHRVGPHRVFVELARDLAAAGFVSLRFDVSGLGDSEARRDTSDHAESADLDLRDAMDAVTRRTGNTRFLLVGFCSGVDAAHRVALKDPRVVGAIHIEGYSYRTPGFMRRLPLRLLSPERWSRRLSGALDIVRAIATGQQPIQMVTPELIYKRDFPDWGVFSRDMAKLTQRGVRFLFVYSGLDTDFNHPDQFWEMFGTPELDRARIDIYYVPKADHIFFDVDSRRQMIARVVQFTREHFHL